MPIKSKAITIPPAPPGMSPKHHAAHVVDECLCEMASLLTAMIPYIGSGPDEVDAFDEAREAWTALEKLHKKAAAAHTQFECAG